MRKDRGVRNKSGRYVSRAGDKLASVATDLKLDFKNKIVLDVGSSTGGFTDYALQNGARKVVAVELGTNQLHPKLRDNPRIELHEKTDILDYKPLENFDVILMDLSFISLRKILPNVIQIANKNTEIVALFKPQFETNESQKNRGVVKNNSIRRELMKDFEGWVKNLFNIVNKADSKVVGTKGNKERFYKLKVI